MSNIRATIIDLSGARARAGQLAGPRANFEVSDGFAPPLRVAIRKTDAGFLTWAGEEAEPLVEDAQTLVFDELNVHLPRIDDSELREQLLTAVWSKVCERLADNGLLHRPGQSAAYVIPRAGWPPALLEHFREVCARDGRLRLIGFPDEAAALVVGLMQADMVRRVLSSPPASGSATYCLAVAAEDTQAIVCCFDYASDGRREHRVVLRDFFRTKYRALADDLKSREWSSDVSGLLVFESPELATPACTALEATLRGVRTEVTRPPLPPAQIQNLKLVGGAYIAQCSMALGEPADHFVVEAAYHIGVQTSQRRFHPILTRSQMTQATQYPLVAEQRFRLKGRPGSEMRVNVYCGYSPRVAEATYLGHFTLSQVELARLGSDREAAIAASVTMDSPGSAEVALHLLPDNRRIASRQWLLPALMD
ncbi:MAG TPA: hypothetical protein VKA60_17265 [Blastocatellia bacterium]|nr:hypothetical protein [Blastocatellia bacterium]